MDTRFSWVVRKGLQSTAPSCEWVKVLHLYAYNEGKHHCLEQELGIFCAEVDCWLMKWCLSQRSQTHSAGFCFAVQRLCAVMFPFSSKKANSASQNGLFAYPVLRLVFLALPLGLCKLTRLLWPFWWWVAFPMLCFSWSLLTKLPRQPPSLGSSPAFVYLWMVEVCLGTSFLFLMFGLGVWSLLWSNVWLLESTHVTGRVGDECSQVFAFVCSWAGMGALGLLVCFNIQYLVMIHLDCRKSIGGKLSSTGDFSGGKV